MKSRIWRLAGVGLLCVSVGAQALADEPQNRGPENNGHGGEHQGNQGHGGERQPHGQNNPPPQNPPRPQNSDIIRGDNSRQFEHNGQPHNNGQWQNQNRAPNQPAPVHQAPPANNLPIQPRPDTVRQTQEPRQGYYRDERPQNGYHNQQWQTGNRPNDNRWPGRPDGHGNGWGPGPQYRPGHVIDRFPDREYRVPYRGQDYFYSGGYWYRPQGPRYIVVQPPRGIRIQYLPDTPAKYGSAVRCCSSLPVPTMRIRKPPRITSWSSHRCSNRRSRSRNRRVMTSKRIRPTVSRRNRCSRTVTSATSTRCSKAVSIHVPRRTNRRPKWCRPTARLRAIA